MGRITRREFIKTGNALVGATAVSSALGQTESMATKPEGKRRNILFICVDQLRSFADLPIGVPLPNIQRLRARGWTYANYHVHEAPCAPSRSVIYTGQHIQKTGVYNNPPSITAHLKEGERVIELPVGLPTIGTMLRDQGYYTAYKGKWHLSIINQKMRLASDRDYPSAEKALEPYGFSDYNFDGEHSGDTWDGFGHDGFIAADAINLLRGFASAPANGRPWFLAVNFINPHDIMFFDATGTQNRTRPNPNLIGLMKSAPPISPYGTNWNVPLPRSFYKDDLSHKPASQHAEAESSARIFGAIDSEQAWAVYQNYYLNCIRDVDRNIGMVLDALDALKLADSTIVVLTSDHGERGGAHHMRGKGGDMYKETVRVPLVIRHPDVPGSGEIRALASAVDLAPTLLSWSGLDPIERQRLYPLLKGYDLGKTIGAPHARTGRDDAGILFNYMTPTSLSPRGDAPDANRILFRGIFDGRYKFARYFNVAQHHIPTDWETLRAYNDLELYDTATDTDELDNLAYDPGQRRALILALNSRLNALIAREIGVDDGSIYPGPPEKYRLARQTSAPESRQSSLSR